MADSKAQANKLKDQGNAALADGKVDEAINFYTEAINLDPINHVLYSNRSAAYTKASRYADALTDAEKTVELQPTWVKGYSRKGAALEYIGSYREASKAYEEGLKIEPNNQQLLDSLADVKRRMQPQDYPNYDNPFSSPDLMVKLAMNPKTRDYLKDPSYLAMLKELQRNPSTMSNFLKDKRILNTLGVLMGLNLEEAGEEDMDVSENDTVHNETPRNSTFADKKGDPPAEPLSDEKRLAIREKELGNDAYRKRNFDVALQHYEKASTYDPTDMTFLNNIAAVYFEQQKFEDCIKQCEKAIAIGRENRADFKIIAKSYSRTANAYSKLKNYGKAKEFYEKSLTEHRTPETKSKLSEVEKIFKEEQKAAYVNPEIALDEKNKGNDCFSKGDYPQAVKHYTEAILRNPDDAKLYSNRAACYTKLAEFQLGLRDCDECIRLDPDFIKGYIRKGTILMALKEQPKAAAAFRKAIELDPNNQEAMDGFRRCSVALNSDPEEVRRRAMSDPEVQKILKDPAMRLILEQMQDDPKALQEHLRNPEIAAKIQKLIESGLIAIR